RLWFAARRRPAWVVHPPQPAHAGAVLAVGLDELARLGKPRGLEVGEAALAAAARGEHVVRAVLLPRAADAALLAADAEADEQRARQLLALAQQLGDELALLLE